MLKDALKARIPMIRVTTDDPVNTEAVLQSVAQTKHIAHLDTLTATVLFKADHLLWTDNPKLLTPENYDLLDRKEKCLVFVNTEPHTLLFEAGPLLPTAQQVQGLVSQYTVTDLSQYLQGMDLKAVDHTLRLTSVKFGNLLPSSIRSMRAMLGVPIQGLYPVDTKPEFYQPHESLVEWMAPNVPYFLAPKVSAGLRPRGLLLEGLPGTGKSAASRWVARTLGVPLYRLDIATSMNKYIGESELRLMRILRQLEDYAPCVVPSTRIRTTVGELTAEDIASRCDTEQFWFDSVNPDTGLPCVVQLHRMIKREGAPCLKITTATGVIECTENHRLLVQRGDALEWVEAKDLQVGDDVLEV